MEHPEIKGWGADADLASRPGVPREHRPEPHPAAPPLTAQQEPRIPVLLSPTRRRLTPVFGDGPPPRGLSGAIKRLAYRLPEHRASRWMLLMLSDRVDAVEHAFWPLGKAGYAALAGLVGFRVARQLIQARR
jgi:hypothetical protein